MPVMRHSTHSCIGCDCSAAAHASATAASTMGALLVGHLGAHHQAVKSGRTAEPGEGPPWYTRILVVLAQNLSEKHV